MQAGKQQPNQPPVKIYNAVYSSVQVYECMIRGIAVMRRRADSFVNATQILKVAGVDKGRRTKILEKEILPGRHEIVQGGYGKYQGTWIPMERGRDIAIQYGVAPLLSPLFDFTPTTHSLAPLTVSAPGMSASPRPLSASSSYSSLGHQGQYPSSLAPPPIMPGSALRLLNQGRAQGLFTPSTSSLAVNRPGYQSPGGTAYMGYAGSPFPNASDTPPPQPQTLKRFRSENDVEQTPSNSDVAMFDLTRSASAAPPQTNGASVALPDGPSPTKRQRIDPALLDPQQAINSHVSFKAAPKSSSDKGKSSSDVARFATKPSIPRNIDPTVPLKDTRRAAALAAICQADEPVPVLTLLREIAPLSSQNSNANNPPAPDATPSFDIDTILDDQGHTALHIAAAVSRLNVVKALISHGADVHRGNHLGETPLIRAILSTHVFDTQSLPDLLELGLSRSILTLDTSRKTVLHHIVLLAGVKGRSVVARYYLDQIFYRIAKHDGGDFSKIVDLQDEHGDTALNIAARVGSRTLVRTLVDVGANRTLMNKLGLRPGDFGVESEELGGGKAAEDAIAMLRTVPTAPIQKSHDVLADITTMIQSLSVDFQSEIKSKQDALDVTQAHLRAATRELSEQRKQIQQWQIRCAELDVTSQKLKNVEKAIEEEKGFDWTGRQETQIPKPSDSALKNSPAFYYRGVGFTTAGMTPEVSLDPNPPLPMGNDIASLIRLRRMQLWYQRIAEVTEERKAGLQGASAEKEYICRKIVALCTSVPVDKVDDMLEHLVTAVESESQIVDISRVSGFMQKVKDGIL